MCVADPRGTQKDDVLGAFDEGATGELGDLLPVDGGLEGEVEVLEPLAGRKAGEASDGLGVTLVGGRDAGGGQLLGEAR